MPGAEQPFREFNTKSGLENWVLTQSKDPQKRNALAGHFSLYNRQDGNVNNGVETALKNMANDRRHGGKSCVNVNPSAIQGDVFADITASTGSALHSGCPYAG